MHLQDSKTGERVVPLNEPAKKVLEKLKQQPGNPYVFCSNTHKNGRIVNIEKAWQKIRKRADLNDVRIHDLRHSFASFAIKQGLDLYQVAKLLGHKNIRTTTRYAHLAREDLIKASNIVGGVFVK
ncbi:MAG: site-specific integrase [Alphaproteobacteria bacterium]|nr:site-specific integrase [Alphaproteobacteria bacterium]MCI5058141.1 site-specific integrase [Flavobacteriales bacterium]